MASRNYGVAFDTPYNERLLRILEKYDMNRDTNGEPDDIQQMVGGAVVRRGRMTRDHPHLYNPMIREMQGGKQREFVLEGGFRPPGMVSPFIQSVPPDYPILSGTMNTYPMYNAVEMRAMNGGFIGPLAMAGLRLAGPAIASSLATVLADKAVRKITGSGIKGSNSRMAAGNILDRKFSINDVGRTGKQLFGMGQCGGNILDEKFSVNDVVRTGKKLFGRGVGKSKPKKEEEVEKIVEKAKKVRKARAEAPRTHGSVTEEDKALVASLPKQGKGVVEKVGKFAKRLGKAGLEVAQDVAVDVAKEALKSYLTSKTKTGKGVAVMKGGAVDGRKARAAIVKRVMAEKGLKLIEASRFVKEHGLYKK